MKPNARKPLSGTGFGGAEDGNRTRTTLAGPRILSPTYTPALSDVIAQHRT